MIFFQAVDCFLQFNTVFETLIGCRFDYFPYGDYFFYVIGRCAYIPE